MSLTEQQREVAEADPAARILVTAGPGTGKTHVLIARLVHLIGRHSLSPGHEILVLSFSRAAVREIRNRVAVEGGDARFVRAVTFDSFATRLLSEVEPNGSWVQEGYDGRIRSATGAVETNNAAKEFLRSHRHILVDEIQDLVGVRADFVQAILRHADCGFSLFGDPAQGIYNFQLEGDARRAGSAAHYKWVRREFGKTLIEKTLSQNFRAQSDIARAAVWAGDALNADDPDYKKIRYDLDTLVLELPSLGDLSSALPMLRSEGTRSTAILCRTNGQALVVSRDLWKAGVDHRLQREATDRVVPSWVALTLRDLSHASLAKTQFIKRAERIGEVGDPQEAWRLLKRLDPRRSDDLDVRRVGQRLREGSVPDELTETQPSSLVVSTIHRAKGLEFDRVVIVEPGDDEEDDDLTLAEETRVLYVSLTRPKLELFHMRAPETFRLRKMAGLDDRWVAKGWKKWMTLGIEIRGHDIHSADPAGGFVLDGVDPVETQDYLASQIKRGDILTFERIRSTSSGSPRVFYSVKHEGRPVGITCERFGGLLFATLKVNRSWTVQWPKSIEELFVDGVDTVAGTDAAGRRCGLGESGLWLRVRAVGLGRFTYDKSAKGK